MASEHYAAFIEEAFVAPIRSVLIVDDDYPTFDEMLEQEISHKGEGRPPRNDKKWYDAPDRIENVIDSFRRPERPLLVDIHDGANLNARGDAKVAAHLHQGLMPPATDMLGADEVERAKNLIAEREDTDEAFVDAIGGAVAIDQYLHSRLQSDTYLRTMGKGQQPYAGFAALADAAGWDNDVRRLVLRHLLSGIEAPLRERMNIVAASGIKWAASGTRWIKSESVFIAFSSKADHDDLLGDLKNALNA